MTIVEPPADDPGNALMWYWEYRTGTDPQTVVSQATGEQYTIYSAVPVWPKEEE